ncbi:uncharacterized protein ACNS7B_021176 [Menidia menidia]
MHVMGSVSPTEGSCFQEEDVAVAVATSSPPPSRFSDIKETGTRLSDPPPPPPPLPPLPPPPPPPLLPLAPGLGDSVVGLMKKRRVRSFFWKTIPEEQVKGRANLWTQRKVQRHFHIDVQKIEELFGQNDSRMDATSTRGGKSRASFREAKEEVSILDAKRAMNVAIFLKQFKRSNQAIVDDVRRGNSASFGAEPLRELLKLLPEAEEVRKLNGHGGDASRLPLADAFLFLLIQVPSYSVRIESMLLKEEFHGACEAMRQDIKILRSATKELMCCEELHAVLHLVLQAGNILNAGGYAGNAVGFKLSSLLSLADTKANKPGMNLLHFVALEAQKKDEKLLQFPLKLSNVQAASRIHLETLDAELQLLTSRTCSVEERIQKDTELLQQLDGFLQSATSSLGSLRGGRQQLQLEGSELIDFFCEDRELFRLDECFSIFHSFCSRFSQAVKENAEREAKEAARRRRLQEEEQKRHSWAGGEKVGGASTQRFGSETDMLALAWRREEAGLLVELQSLKPRPQQRTRHSPSHSPSIAAERELSSLLGMRGAGDTNQTRPENMNQTNATYLNQERAQTHSNITHNAIKVPVQPSSPPNKVTGNITHNAIKVPVQPSSPPNKVPVNITHNAIQGPVQPSSPPDRTFGLRPGNSGRESDTKANVCVVLEKCSLVPELKAFDRCPYQDGRRVRQRMEDLEITDLEEEVQNNPKETERKEEDEEETQREKGEEETQREEDEEETQREEGEEETQREEGEEETQREEGLEETQREEGEEETQREEGEEDEEEEAKVIVWCVTGVCEASGENTEGGGGHQGPHASSTNQSPGELRPEGERPGARPISSQPAPCRDSSSPASSPGPRPASDAPGESANQGAEEEKALNDESAVLQHSEKDRSRNKNKTTDGNAKPRTSSKLSAKNVLPSRPQLPGIKPPTSPSATSSANRPKSARPVSEHQDLRRVLPLGRGPASSHRPERPPPLNRSSAPPPPSSRRFTANKPPDLKQKDQREQRILGVQRRAPPPRPREEKICLSKLRSLGSKPGSGGSVSAPVTPMHRTRAPPTPKTPPTTTPPTPAPPTPPTCPAPPTPLPGFARNTASSSFRLSGSPKPSGFSRTGSLKAPPASPLITPPAQPRRPQGVMVAPPRGHRRNDSGGLSDKSNQSRDSGKTTRPGWR